MDFCKEINGRTLEYFEDEHLYLVDGIIVPSITELLKVKFGKKYSGVDKETLQRAAAAGTAVHEAIERYCVDGEISELPEVRNFVFLMKQFKFDVVENEVPVILFIEDEPFAAGRLDLTIKTENGFGIADIKRTSTLDKEYLAYQLNLYRLAYMQSYGVQVDVLRGIHLRADVRKYVPLPINETAAWKIVFEYMGVPIV